MFHINRSAQEDVPEIALTITNRTLFRVIIVIIITLALVAAVLRVTHALLLLLVAFSLAVALNAPVAKVAKVLPGKRKGSRSIATTVSFLIVIILIGGFAAYVVPPLVHQTEKFISAAPSLVNSAKSQNSSLGHFIRSHQLQNAINNLSGQISHRLRGISGKAFNSLAQVASSIFSVLAILVLTFMMLVEGPKWLKVSKDILIPDKKSAMVERVARDMYEVVRGYVNGQVFLALVAAVSLAPALILLHISYPIALMVVVFLAGLIPMIGHTIGAVIVSVVALFHSVTAALIVLLYYIFYMQLENYLLQPRIQASSTNMSPLLVFASIIIGVNFAGLFGGLVAIPVAACIKVILLEYLTQKKMLPADFNGKPNHHQDDVPAKSA